MSEGQFLAATLAVLLPVILYLFHVGGERNSEWHYHRESQKARRFANGAWEYRSATADEIAEHEDLKAW